jgi:putative tryptophan/tyrosine transport system substrate-binding protein
MRRRNFIRGLAATAAWPVAGRAQQPERVRRIGVLQPGARDDPENRLRLTTFQQALQGLGWTDGRNVHIETRFSAAGDAADARKNAAELAALAPDVILSVGSSGLPAVPGLCRSFLYSSPIRWAPASSIACRSQAVTPLAL